MTILEKCLTLEKKIEQYEQREKLTQLVQVLSPIKEELERKNLQAEKIWYQFLLFRHRDQKNQKKLAKLNSHQFPYLDNDSISNQLDFLNKAKDHLIDVQNKIEQSPNDIAGGRSYKNLLSTLDKFIDETGKILLQRWRNYVDRENPNINQVILNKLQAFRQFNSEIGKIKELNEKLKGLREKVPQEMQEIESLWETIKLLKEAFERLPINNLPKDVQAFLEAAASANGAQLDCLTPTVVQWLKDNKLYKSFAIKPLQLY